MKLICPSFCVPTHLSIHACSHSLNKCLLAWGWGQTTLWVSVQKLCSKQRRRVCWATQKPREKLSQEPSDVVSPSVGRPPSADLMEAESVQRREHSVQSSILRRGGCALCVGGLAVCRGYAFRLMLSHTQINLILLHFNCWCENPWVSMNVDFVVWGLLSHLDSTTSPL